MSGRRQRVGGSAAADRQDPDRGSAVAEFVMVLGLLLVLFLALVQICLWAYVRTLAAAATAEAARNAALAGASSVAMTDRVRSALGGGLAGSTAQTLVCTGTTGAQLIEVHCTLEAPGLVGLLDGVMPQIDVRGHAALEDPT